jgi:phosphoglycerol transferase MdoB-like AlkP superfamily enzyme
MTGPYSELLKAFWVGVRFDLRLACIIILPLAFIFMIPVLNPLNNFLLRKLSQIYLWIVTIVVLLFYTFDLGNYSYLDQRIDISSFKLLENPAISFGMVFETYPVFWITLGFAIIMWILWKGINRSFLFLNEPPVLYRNSDKSIGFFIGSMILLFAFWGTFRQYRLLWSDAHFSNDPFIVAVALNPVLYFNETRTFASKDYDEELTRNYYDLISHELGVDGPDINQLNFSRLKKGIRLNQNPNIVIIFLESVSLNRMGRIGNPLNPTPSMDMISNEGIFFDHFYIPTVGTARSVFGMVTGIHDVADIETATSNPQIVDQYTLINSLKGYQKKYFIGGSASWRNIRGLLNNNIPEMRITEQTDLDFPRLDVWGISDHDLFTAAHNNFSSSETREPFFAIIQTASNHRPYSIPKNIDSFSILEKSETKLNQAGFSSLSQYNAMRLLDNAIGDFITKAKQEAYFDNSIFIFFGDHGTSDPPALHMQKSDFDLKLRSYRVPFFVYAPKIIKGGKTVSAVSQLVDIMPTVCGLAGVEYRNRTMGRDLFNDSVPNDPLALIVNNKVAKSHIAVIGKNYYLSMQKDGDDIQLHELDSNNPLVDVKDKYPEITVNYSHRLRGIYETAKYMLYHNKN